MASSTYDILGIGNAIVDVIARADEQFLAGHDMRKGTMSLIDEARAEKIYASMGPAIEISGGSAANTIVGAASFGARTAFVGKVKNDTLGQVFAHDIRAAGVAFDTAAATGGPSTARCYVIVTPDGERTMNTYLGAAQNLSVGDLSADAIASATITYLEGYLWDPQDAKDAFVKAASIAHGAKRQVALTLSDAFCVGRFRSEFVELIRSGTVDILFANEAELHSLYETDDFDAAHRDVAKGREARRRNAQRERLRGRHSGRHRSGARPSRRAGDRYHRRRRSVRRRVPLRALARRAASPVGRAWRACRRRNHPAPRRPPADVAESARRTARLLSCRFPDAW